MAPDFDAVVVGSGLTGSWAARELVIAGLNVLLLEAGPRVGPEHVGPSRAWDPIRRERSRRSQAVQAKHPSYWIENPSLFVNDFENPYSTRSQAFLWIRGRQLGGRSLTWGGVALRFSDGEFQAPQRDGIGESWPLSYHDLAPYYDHVETTMGVSGSIENLDQLPDGKFLTPPRLTNSEARFKAVVEKRWNERRVIVSRGITSSARDRNEAVGWSQKTTMARLLPEALQSGRLTLRVNCVASHLIADASSPRVRSVACVDTESGNAFEVSGRVIILCASTIESIRILLNSRCRAHPNGIGNSSGLLGKFLMDHMAVCLGGRLDSDQDLRPEPLTGSHSVLIPRFQNLCRNDSTFLRGYGIWGGMGRTAATSAERSTWFLNAIGEVLPRRDNCVEIDESLVDAWGIKSVRISMAYTENELAMREDAASNIREMAEACGLKIEAVWNTVPGEYVHEVGGARMGTRPTNSVLNPFNQCWDSENLFVLDGSCFVTSGWQNPSLTMMALAVRASEYIVRELRLSRL